MQPHRRNASLSLGVTRNRPKHEQRPPPHTHTHTSHRLHHMFKVGLSCRRLYYAKLCSLEHASGGRTVAPIWEALHKGQFQVGATPNYRVMFLEVPAIWCWPYEAASVHVLQLINSSIVYLLWPYPLDFNSQFVEAYPPPTPMPVG